MVMMTTVISAQLRTSLLQKDLGRKAAKVYVHTSWELSRMLDFALRPPRGRVCCLQSTPNTPATLSLSPPAMSVDLAKLNTFLADKTFCSGYALTTEDVAVFNAIPRSGLSGFPHVARFAKMVAAVPLGAKLPAGGSSGMVGAAAAAAPAAAAAADEGEVDLWGDDDDDEEAEAANEARLAAIADAHKAKKAAAGKLKVVVGKSSIVLDVKPWDDETDLAELEKAVRGIKPEGLEWQAGQLEDIGFGIKKLRIMCQVVDDLISVDDDVVEKIVELEDFVQSCDIFVRRRSRCLSPRALPTALSSVSSPSQTVTQQQWLTSRRCPSHRRSTRSKGLSQTARARLRGRSARWKSA